MTSKATMRLASRDTLSDILMVSFSSLYFVRASKEASSLAVVSGICFSTNSRSWVFVLLAVLDRRSANALTKALAKSAQKLGLESLTVTFMTLLLSGLDMLIFFATLSSSQTLAGFCE